jgi:predicted phosphodiesterase
MRTVIVSDLHIGADADVPIFAGQTALPALLATQPAPVRLIFNGDSFDFLLDDEPLGLDVGKAVGKARAILGSRQASGTVAALAATLADGGEVFVRAGNHDLELVLPEVQDVVRATVRAALFGGGADDAAAEGALARLRFDDGDLPMVIEVGGRNVLVTHGEHADPFNRWLPSEIRAAAKTATVETDVFPPGSVLVKEIMNPLKHRMRFLDLLKPDFHGAVMAALAVNPAGARQLLKRATLTILSDLVRNAMDGMPFPGPGEEPDAQRQFAVLLGAAELDAAELDVLDQVLDPDAEAFGVGDLVSGVIRHVRAKLGRAGLRLYARLHRRVAGHAGEEQFDEAPSESEWDEALRLARKFDASVVVSGHTHARRVGQQDGVDLVNTGTWIRLMKLPAADASLDEWVDLLEELRADPLLETSTRAVLDGTACIIDDTGAVSVERVR